MEDAPKDLEAHFRILSKQHGVVNPKMLKAAFLGVEYVETTAEVDKPIVVESTLQTPHPHNKLALILKPVFFMLGSTGSLVPVKFVSEGFI
ncbi:MULTISPECIES: hypothetical protein [unclassified Sphingobacterium]|uniref:hypothetical protein n=1 Tax=unclassified Sphingobacterium TaxID=2609468 RepID=UPI0025FB2E00|nr:MULTISPECIES: hypothetical protein [unclassified Sphingobacterium]